MYYIADGDPPVGYPRRRLRDRRAGSVTNVSEHSISDCSVFVNLIASHVTGPCGSEHEMLSVTDWVYAL